MVVKTVTAFTMVSVTPIVKTTINSVYLSFQLHFVSWKFLYNLQVMILDAIEIELKYDME